MYFLLLLFYGMYYTLDCYYENVLVFARKADTSV